jgi:hypothetical protein
MGTNKMTMTSSEVLDWIDKLMKSQGMAMITDGEYEDAKVVYEEIKKLCAENKHEKAHDTAKYLASMLEEFKNSPIGE